MAELTPLKSAMAACRKMQSMNSTVRSLACGIRSLKEFSQQEDHLNLMSKVLEQLIEDHSGNGEGSWVMWNDKRNERTVFVKGVR